MTAQDGAAPANNWGTPQAGTSWTGQDQPQPQTGGWGDNGGAAAAGTAPGAWGTPQPATGGWAPTAPDANVGAAGTTPAGWGNPATGAPPAWQSSDNSAPTTILRGDSPMPMPVQSPPPPAPAAPAPGTPVEWNPHDEDQIQTGMWQVFAVDDNLGAKGPAAAGSRPQPQLPPNVTPLSAADSPVPSNVTPLPSNVTPLQPAAPQPVTNNTGQQPQPKLSAMGENIMDRLHTILGDGLEGMAAGTQPLPGSTPPPEAPPAPGAPNWGAPAAGQPGQPQGGGWNAPDQGAASFGPEDDLPIQEKLRRQQMAAQQGQPDPSAQPAWGAPQPGPQPGNGMQPAAWGAPQGNNWGGDQPPAQPAAGSPPINQQWETQQIGAVSQEQLAQAAAAAAAAPPNGGWETPSASAQGGWAPAAEQQIQQGGWNAPSQAVAQAPVGPAAPPAGGLYRNIDNQAINTVFRENLSTKDGIHAAPAAVVAQPVAAPPSAFAAPAMPAAATAAPGVMAQPQAAAAPPQAPMAAPAATPEPAGLLGRIDDQAIDRIFAENLGIRDSLAASAVRREEFEAEQAAAAAAAAPPPMMQPPPGLEGMVPQSQASLAQQAPAPAPVPLAPPPQVPPQAPPPFAGMPTNVDQTGGWNIPPQIQQIQQQQPAPAPAPVQQQPAWNVPGPETQQQQQQSGWNIPQQAAPEQAGWNVPPQQAAPEPPAAWTPPPQQPAPEQPTWNAPPQLAAPEQAGWNVPPQQPAAPPAPPQLAPPPVAPPQLPPQQAAPQPGWNPAPAGQPPMDQMQPQQGGWGMPSQQPAAAPQASAMQAIFSGEMGGGQQAPQLGADGQPLNVARAVEAVREAAVEQASAPDVPKVEGIGRLAKDDQTAEPTSGKIAQIGKFLLDSSDFNKLGNLASTPDLPDAKVRVLTLEAADEINKLLNHIATQPGVVGSVIVGHDGILIASNLPSDVDPESVGIWSLGIYVNTLNSTKKLGHNHLHQLVARSRFGYLVVADFGGGILVTVSNGQETDKLIPLMRSITQLVAQ